MVPGRRAPSVSTEEPELDDNPFNQFRATSVRVG